jgi:hypothetical protein
MRPHCKVTAPSPRVQNAQNNNKFYWRRSREANVCVTCRLAGREKQKWVNKLGLRETLESNSVSASSARTNVRPSRTAVRQHFFRDHVSMCSASQTVLQGTRFLLPGNM